MTFKVQKVDLMEGFKVAAKVVGRSAKKADATVELKEENGKVVLRAAHPGLSYLRWTICGTGTVPFQRLIVPLDMLRGVVERMPKEDISITTDPKNPNKLKVKSGSRSGTITAVDGRISAAEIDNGVKITYEGVMKDLSPSIKIFDKVSLGGFNTWGCVCAAQNGTGYATDEGNLYAAPFPIMEKSDRDVMIPTQFLIPVTLLHGDVAVRLTEDEVEFSQEGWAFVLSLNYVQAPNYKRVLDRFKKSKMVPIDMDPLTKEVKDFRKACKDGSLIVSVVDGTLKVRAARDAAIAYQSERAIKESPDFEFTVIPENYLKVGPNFKSDVSIAKADGSHIYLESGGCCGIVSCHAGTIKFG